jgi:hypothetical protein
MGSEQ